MNGDDDKVRQLREIRERLLSWYETPAEIETWLHSAQKALGGAVPVDLIRDGGGEHVLALLDRLEGGTFT